MNERMRLRVTLPSGRRATVISDEPLTPDDWISLGQMCEQSGKLSMRHFKVNGIVVGMAADDAPALLEALNDRKES